MAAPIRIGMLTPSSNTCLEPVTIAMLRHLEPEVSVHFTRVPVTRIGLGRDELAQFDFAPMLSAARLLAEAEVSVIAWSGTSGSWLGLEHDLKLCRLLQREIDVPATTSTIALLDALRVSGADRYGLAVPYTKDVAERIVATYAAHGFQCSHMGYLEITRNFDFDQVSPERIARLVSDVAPSSDAVAVVCTNLRAAPLVERLEAQLGIPVIDSVVATVWKALDMALGSLSLPNLGDLAVNGSLRARLQAILDDLLQATGASRATIRVDIPERGLRVDGAVAEALAAGVDSTRRDGSVEGWEAPAVQFMANEHRELIQNGVRVDDPPSSPELVERSGVGAQMLAPLISDDRMYGWLSVHQVGDPRVWQDAEIRALQQARERAQVAIGKRPIAPSA